MAANKVLNFNPVAMANVATNIMNPPTLTGGTGLGGTNTATYIIVRHVTIVNRTASSATFSLYKGATGASVSGTEIIGNATPIPANSSYTFYCGMRFDTTDFLVGLASAAATLTIQLEGEIGVA